MNDTNTAYDTAVRDADFDDFADSATAVTSDASDADEIATTLATCHGDSAAPHRGACSFPK